MYNYYLLLFIYFIEAIIIPLYKLIYNLKGDLIIHSQPRVNYNFNLLCSTQPNNGLNDENSLMSYIMNL